MDIYDEDDQVISSDEYSETDDLLNVAISAVSAKTEPEKLAKQFHYRNRKPQDKKLEKLANKLRKKSVQWMHQKGKRIDIRKRYLCMIARAKCINKPKGGAEHQSTTKIEPNKANLAEQIAAKSVEAKVIPQETIDLDDSDDDDDDEDDYDESSSNSSNSSNEDIDDLNEDYDDDMDSIKHSDEDKDDDMNKIKHNLNEIKDDFVAKEVKIQPAVDVSKVNKQNEALKNVCDNLELNVDEPKVEQLPVKVEEEAISAQIFPQVANSTFKEGTESQIDLETITAPAAAKVVVKRPTYVEAFTSMDFSMAADYNESNSKNITKDSCTLINNGTQADILDISKDLGIEQSYFFNDDLNAMYPNFNRIVDEHVTFSQTAEIIKQRIKLIAADVEHINKEIEVKERECNQLMFVKHTKEQILARLLRKIKHNEISLDDSEIETLAARELGIVPKPKHTKEPPAKKRKIEPRTAQEIIEHSASMSMDEVLRSKIHSQEDSNFIDETLKRYGLNTPKRNDKLKANFKKLNNGKSNFLDNSLNFTMPEKPEKHHPRSRNHQQAASTVRSEQNLLLNLLNNDNDSDDAAAISYDMPPITRESSLAQLLDKWSDGQPRQKTTQQNLNGRADDTHYDDFVEERAQTSASKLFPILNQSKRTQSNADETLIVELDLNDFRDEAATAATQKTHSNNINHFTCQYCGIHKAQYVCAECENQWYCSRSCQVAAWDSHCETCE